MAQDEGRFGRISTPKRSWAPPGIRPKAPKQIVRESIYAYAAVCPALGKMTSLVLPFANIKMMDIFLAEVSKDFVNYFVIMLVDGAGWHTSPKLNIPENIKFIQQPSHSPELNPAEHIWDEVREDKFHNKAYDSLDAVEAGLCEGLNELHSNPEKLRSLTNFPYLDVSTVILNDTS